MELKNKFEEYTEAEFLDFLNKIWAIDVVSEAEHDKLIAAFVRLTEHPQGNGLIFYPSESVEDSPAGVLIIVKEWRAANGKPGFKAT